MQKGEQELELASEQTRFSKAMAARGDASSSSLVLVMVVPTFQRGRAGREAEPSSPNHPLMDIPGVNRGSPRGMQAKKLIFLISLQGREAVRPGTPFPQSLAAARFGWGAYSTAHRAMEQK